MKSLNLKKCYALFCFAVMAFVTTSCNKEISDADQQTSNTSIQGNWKFIGLHAEIKSTALVKEGSTETKIIPPVCITAKTTAATS